MITPCNAMHVIIDERESALYDKCIDYLTTNPLASIQLSKSMLPLGDILFRTDDGKLISIIERKSLSDLLSSIKDGRYDEQSHRLAHNGECSLHQVLYLVEGVMGSLRSAQERKLIFSAITTLNFFKGFSVLRSSSVQESAEMLILMADKIGRKMTELPIACNVREMTDTSTQQNYCVVVKKTKKDNITPQNIGEILLCQIPSISSTTAIAIMKHFDTFPHLMDALKTDPTCLDNITTDKSRKISKQCIANIRTFLVTNSI
jgi:crossover junction endonuclease MUS81